MIRLDNEQLDSLGNARMRHSVRSDDRGSLLVALFFGADGDKEREESAGVTRREDPWVALATGQEASERGSVDDPQEAQGIVPFHWHLVPRGVQTTRGRK
jgi:hypothetical protein